MHKLSDFFKSVDIVNDGHFLYLDQAASTFPNSLCYCQNLQFLYAAEKNPHVSCIICKENVLRNISKTSLGIAVSQDPRLKFFEMYIDLSPSHNLCNMNEFGIGHNVKIHPTATISHRALIGDNVTIGANCYIADNTRIEDNVFIAQNTVIGADGMLTIRSADNKKLFVEHSGSVHIKSGCQILAGVVIARSLFQEPTTIGENSQIGILANVGHGVVLGSDCVVSSNSVIAGRSRLGKSVWLGASSVIAQGLHIGDDVQIKTGSIVVSSLPAKSVVSGNFAINHRVNVESYIKHKIL